MSQAERVVLTGCCRRGWRRVDRHANLNSTVIGDYEHPRTRLPGAGGAPEIAASCGEVIVIAPHTKRTFVKGSTL